MEENAESKYRKLESTLKSNCEREITRFVRGFNTTALRDTSLKIINEEKVNGLVLLQENYRQNIEIHYMHDSLPHGTVRKPTEIIDMNFHFMHNYFPLNGLESKANILSMAGFYKEAMNFYLDALKQDSPEYSQYYNYPKPGDVLLIQESASFYPKGFHVITNTEIGLWSMSNKCINVYTNLRRDDDMVLAIIDNDSICLEEGIQFIDLEKIPRILNKAKRIKRKVKDLSINSIYKEIATRSYFLNQENKKKYKKEIKLREEILR